MSAARLACSWVCLLLLKHCRNGGLGTRSPHTLSLAQTLLPTPQRASPRHRTPRASAKRCVTPPPGHAVNSAPGHPSRRPSIAYGRAHIQAVSGTVSSHCAAARTGLVILPHPVARSAATATVLPGSGHSHARGILPLRTVAVSPARGCKDTYELESSNPSIRPTHECQPRAWVEGSLQGSHASHKCQFRSLHAFVTDSQKRPLPPRPSWETWRGTSVQRRRPIMQPRQGHGIVYLAGG
jgi:hypothetical protein